MVDGQLGEFLRARREAVHPADVGLETGVRRRRVPGLRREEVALRSGISAEYYIRLEQGGAPPVAAGRRGARACAAPRPRGGGLPAPARRSVARPAGAAAHDIRRHGRARRLARRHPGVRA
ncbi:helix-turn-helix domain-containing protein [Pseudolysinimonas kribbensis]|uniref:helix-turn-helix domain-containing protein n=1 Tax=Pseudolysinimonas kribbensis TaxID=433641 RepID=UPI003D67D395